MPFAASLQCPPDLLSKEFCEPLLVPENKNLVKTILTEEYKYCAVN